MISIVVVIVSFMVLVGLLIYIEIKREEAIDQRFRTELDAKVLRAKLAGEVEEKKALQASQDRNLTRIRELVGGEKSGTRPAPPARKRP